MGVEYLGVCHSCKEYIDAHKSYIGYDMANSVLHTRDKPTYSDFDKWTKLGWWDLRLVWFCFKHAKHEVEIVSDASGDGEYFDYMAKYQEVCSPEQMDKQKARLQSL
jgi:hypothetical protein